MSPPITSSELEVRELSKAQTFAGYRIGHPMGKILGSKFAIMYQIEVRAVSVQFNLRGESLATGINGEPYFSHFARSALNVQRFKSGSGMSRATRTS